MKSHVKYISTARRHPRGYERDLFDTTFNSIVLPLTFICVNMVAFVVRADLAAMMMVPNILVLFQMKLIRRITAISLIALPISISALSNTDTVYILAIHCLFYMAFLMKMIERGKRSTYDALFKERAIKAVESGTTNSAAAARQFGVPESTVRQWIKNKEELELRPRSGTAASSRCRIRRQRKI